MIEENKKNNNKRILIIILVIISVLLGILLCVLHIIVTLKNNNIIDSKQRKPDNLIKENPEDYSINDVLSSFGCKDISYSLEKDEENNYYYDIELQFKNDLYTNNQSEEKYFDDIVKVMNEKLNRPYIITDSKRRIEIYSNKEEGIYTINDVEDYFNNNKYVEVNSQSIIKTSATSKDSKELNFICINGWSRSNLKIEQEPKSIDSEWIDYGSFKENYSNININYVVYNKEYESAVVSGIKVGTSFNEIKEILGTPHFKYSDIMIGYKMDDLYAFFYDDEIVVYPNLNINNLSFEQRVYEYYSGKYDGYRTKFIAEILNEYTDFRSEMINNGVRLYSYNRGIELFLYDDKTMDITIYANYNFADSLKTLAEAGRINLNFDKDFVFLYEVSRKN